MVREGAGALQDPQLYSGAGQRTETARERDYVAQCSGPYQRSSDVVTGGLNTRPRRHRDYGDAAGTEMGVTMLDPGQFAVSGCWGAELPPWVGGQFDRRPKRLVQRRFADDCGCRTDVLAELIVEQRIPDVDLVLHIVWAAAQVQCCKVSCGLLNLLAG